MAATSRKGRKSSAYSRAGVNIDEMMDGLASIKQLVRATSIKGVKSSIGSFGGLFASPGRNMTLVASTDGVGTKLKVAVMAGRHTTVGQDLVNHCANDILVQGAYPLFFLDYLGTTNLRKAVFHNIISGLCKACRENGCALLGGETAEMPGLYPSGEYDLVGTIIGAVPNNGIITGASIRAGDALIGLASTGLHTNGYSLARKIVFEKARLKIDDTYPGTNRSVADILLAVHRSYLVPVRELMARIPVTGMAHITGGGFPDNVPRILPKNTIAVIDRSSWKVPAVFQFLQERGRVDRDEMYRVFNMGIGFVIAMRPAHVNSALRLLAGHKCKPAVIGVVEKGKPGVVMRN